MKTSRARIAFYFGSLLLASLLCAPASGQNITQLFGFPCSGSACPDGANPVALIQASDGNLYGAAPFTQIGTTPFHGGTLFKLTPSGQFSLLFTFSAASKSGFPNGDFPNSVVEGKDGFLYGSTGAGGAHGQGTIFTISKTGTRFQVLHSFCAHANCADGANPAGIVLGQDGNFYGTTIVAEITLIAFRVAAPSSVLPRRERSLSSMRSMGIAMEARLRRCSWPQTEISMALASAPEFFSVSAHPAVLQPNRWFLRIRTQSSTAAWPRRMASSMASRVTT